MKFRLLLLILAFGLFALLAAGCGTPQPLPVAPTPIPTLIPATLPPEPITASQAAPTTTGSGTEVFNANCSRCHNLDDTRKVGPGLAGVFDRDSLPNGNPVTHDNLKEWIQNGGGAMPGIPLSNDQTEAVIAFLEEATQVEAAEPPQPTAPPEPARSAAEAGAEVFNTNCSVCHNLDDTRKVGPGLAGVFNREALPNGNPVTDDNLKDWIRNGGGGMPGLLLTDEDRAVVIAFLKEATQ